MVEFLIDQALREAIDLHNRNQLDDAKSLYNKIIEHDKSNSDAYHLLSLINLVEGKFDEANKNIVKAYSCDYTIKRKNQYSSNNSTPAYHLPK